MKNLTKRQNDVLLYLRRCLKQNRYSPSCAVISAHFGWSSPNASHGHLKALARKGMVKKTTRGYLPNE